MGTMHSFNLCPDQLVATQVFEAAKCKVTVELAEPCCYTLF